MALQTQPTTADVTAFIDSVDDPQRRADGHRLRELFERVTGAPATMWGPAIVGFGSVNDWMVVGFSPRKAALAIYGVYSVSRAPDPLFDELGPHTTAKGCLYLKRLDKVDESVLEGLVRKAWERAGA